MNWVNVEINGREVSVAFDEHSIHVYNAFMIKDDLKLRGYRWNPGDKSWFISPGNVDSEMEVIKNNLQSTSQPQSRARSSTLISKPVPEPTSRHDTGKSKELSSLPDSCSVADLRNRVDRLIREGIRGNIWVRGIIASDVKNYKWYSYLDLKDEDQNRDIYFKVEVRTKDVEKINRKLSDSGVASAMERDLPVFCNVEVHLPLKNVMDVRLTLLDILPEYTQSKIRNQREITLEKLKQEGILENQKQLLLPAIISRIGLITSEQGTSIKDIKAGLHPYAGKYSFWFVDSRMEGSHAVDSIINALSLLEEQSTAQKIQLDAIVIARGGGSEQSLSVFNDLALCRKICQSVIPVLTAIGHEKDVSALELCSCLTPTPSTPSGIGKFLQNRYMLLQDQLSTTVTRLIHRFTTIHHHQLEKINSYLKNIPTRVSNTLQLKEERFTALTRGLEQSVTFMVRDQERRIIGLSVQLMRGAGELRRKQMKQAGILSIAILTRAGALRQREKKDIEKTIGRLDFDKRLNEHIKKEEKITRKANWIYHEAKKAFRSREKDLLNRKQLVHASDPRRILEKGFTLALDKDNRVIRSLQQFEAQEKATLRFHDGTTDIKKDTPTKKETET